MAYQFSNQVTAKMSITDETETKFSIQGINARETNADIIMAGLTEMLDVVGWSISEAQRIITQDVVEE